MVWNVIGLLHARDRRGCTAIATGGAIGVLNVEVEATHECPPAHTGLVKQIANVPGAHLYLITGRVRANIIQRVGVADDSQ